MTHLRHAVEFNLDPNDMEAKAWLEQLEKTGSLKGKE